MEKYSNWTEQEKKHWGKVFTNVLSEYRVQKGEEFELPQKWGSHRGPQEQGPELDKSTACRLSTGG